MQWRVGGVPHPELIRPELVNVGAFPGEGLVPEAELQQELIPARQQHLPALLSVRRELLMSDRHGSVRFTLTLESER